jgi:hypothetical protein
MHPVAGHRIKATKRTGIPTAGICNLHYALSMLDVS